MASTWVNSENMLAGLKEKMNAEMMAAAEPVIKNAAEAAEKEMRKRLGAMFVALLDQTFSMERMGNDLRILVKHDKSA
jgi:hypothetical protein